MTRETASKHPLPDTEMARVIAASPERMELWDEAERLAAEEQRPEEVTAIYAHVLAEPLPAAVALALCERAAAFLSEWAEDGSAVIAVLTQALEIDPLAGWAFRRLTMLLTIERRWDELLAQYDRLLAATPEPAQRADLLAEAAQVARDLASRADRAIEYLGALAKLRPGEASIVAALERLLEREGRYRELVSLQRSRLADLAPPEARRLRAQIAACLLDKLDSPTEALDETDGLLDDPATATATTELLERAFASATARPADRARALAALRRHYAAEQRTDEIIRVLQAGLRVTEATRPRGDDDADDPLDPARLHRDVAELLVGQGRDAEAVDHYASLIALEPGSESAIAQLRELAERTSRLDRYADALARAADTLGTKDDKLSRRAVELLFDAGTVRSDVLGDAAGAAALYFRIFGEGDADPKLLLDVCRRLDVLLAGADHRADRLDVLERRAGLEPEAATRRDLWTEAAELGVELGDPDRALAAYGHVLAEDPADHAAHDATIALLERAARWPEMVVALRSAADAKDDLGPALRVRAARVLEERLDDPAAAIDAWIEIESIFGADEQTIDALAALLSAAERWTDLAGVLERGVEHTLAPARRLELVERLGEVYRVHTGEPERALACYRAVLGEAPDHPGAREGARALLEIKASRPVAVQLLLEAFAATGDWAGRLSLLEHRLEQAEDDAARTDLLREAADLHEGKHGDGEAALAALARAFPLAPDDVAIERRILALAEATGEHAIAARALGEAVLACEPGARAADLHERRGAILEGRLADAPGAQRAYLAAFTLAPERRNTARAVLRVATQAADWGVAAATIVASARAREVSDPELLGAFEAAADAASAWDAAALSLEDAVEADADLEPTLASELERRAAVWHRDRRSEPAAAEKALRRALARAGDEIETLRLLADVQRRAPGASLVATLLRLAAAGDDVLGALREAAVTALDVLHDEAQSAAIFERLLDEITARLGGSAKPSASQPPDAASWGAAGADPTSPLAELATLTVDKLVELASARADHARAVATLVGAARLPLGEEAALSRLHRAAAIAEEPMGDADRAIALLQTIVTRAPTNTTALARLSILFARADRTEDLLALRRHELSLAASAEDHLRLRLDIAELRGRLGDDEGRLEALRENLAEEPAHERSLEEIARLLTAAAELAALASILEEQAEELARVGRGERAASLFTRASELAETELDDPARALASRVRAADFAPTPDAFDALARLSSVRGDHAGAVAWIERRLEALPIDDDAERVATTARLADAHLASGDAGAARAALERGLVAHPGSEALREPLRALYRAAGAWEDLVALLTQPGGAPPTAAHLREAADVLRLKLGSRERAIPILEALTALAPGDRASRLVLADALRATGALDPARAILDRLLDEYGRRKPPERAEVHTQLARIASAAGDSGEARRQLETAIAMNPEHPGALRLLGVVYRDTGELELSARMFGALLLIALRTPHGGDAGDGPARSEAMIHLHGVLARLGQTARAEEMLASAFEAAKGSDHEARRLEEALRGSSDPTLLLRALELRLGRDDLDSSARSALHFEMAEVLAGPLARSADALSALLDALEHDPASTPALSRAVALARSISGGAVLRTADTIERLAARADVEARSPVAAALHLALGELAERDLAAPARALAAYTRAEAFGADPILAWRAIDRSARAAGDPGAQVRVLRHLVFAGDAGDPAALTEDIYRLAELELSSPADVAAGLGTLEWAMGREARPDRAGAVLRRAADAQPNDPAVLAAYERVARADGSQAMLLDALHRAAAAPGASLDTVREAVDLAGAERDATRVEALLERAVALGEASPAGIGEALWALLALADLREAAGDAAAAVQHLTRAIDAADHDEALRLASRAASLAASRLADPSVAASLYDRLLERDRHDREVWIPLLDLHRRAGDAEALERKLREAIECAFDAAWRMQLRRERASMLLETRWEDAAVELSEVLQEDEDDHAAAALLTELYERHDRRDALVELLDRRLSSARARGDAPAVVALSEKLGALLAPARPDLAIEIYRAALGTTPNSAPILGHLLALYTSGDQGDERAEILERLLGIATGDDASARALDLAALRESAGDDEGVARALQLGFNASPGHPEIRARLASFYQSRERWGDLAEMLSALGAASEGTDSVARLREAAALYLDREDRPAEAAAALDLALTRAPDDRSLLVDLARCLARAGRSDDARDRVSAALARGEASAAGRAALLRLRAELSTEPDQLGVAITDLEAAYAIDPSVAPDLVAGLERRRATPAGSGDRALLLRLVELHLDLGRVDAARDLLGDWIAQEPGDVGALRQAAYLDGLAGRWDQAVALCDRLVDLEEGPARVDAALLLAAACTRAGYPEGARGVLEAVLRDNPGDARIRDDLQRVYELAGSHRELADLAQLEAAHSVEAADRFTALRRAGALYLEAVGDAEAAVAPLHAAHELRPRDGDVTALLADAYIGSGRLQEATTLLDAAIAIQKGRRSREASTLQQRMASIAGAVGDRTNQLGWLNAALDSDAQNSEAAAQLADVATELGQVEIALKALKAIALMKAPKPITRAMAYVRQALIAQDQGDIRKAVTLARKAQSEDPSLREATALLAQLSA